MSTRPQQFRILSPTAILGYGFPAASFQRGMAMKPDLIAVDAGSVDPGPYYLGSGKSFTDRVGVKRDLRFILKAAILNNIPAIIGSAGGSGALPHMDWCEAIVREIAREEKLSFKMARIYADIKKETVIKAIEQGRTKALDGLPELTAETVNESTYLVAQMGVEPFISALDMGCQVILAGRSYDPAVFAAMPIKLGFDPALAIHLGKILECAAIAADPGSGSDCVLGILEADSFILCPLSDERKFTPDSTAAHSLYEKSNPYILPGPGGFLNLENVSFTALPEGQVRVKGSKFEPVIPYTLKLEGARKVGVRTISPAGTRDPIMIRQLDSIIAKVQKKVDDILSTEKIEGKVYFHIYGKNGVMGEREPEPAIHSHEVAIIIEVVSPTQEAADTICSITRSSFLHYGYEGRISTAGNLAFPFSPSDIRCGDVYEFSIYHLMQTDTQDIFKIEIVEI